MEDKKKGEEFSETEKSYVVPKLTKHSKIKANPAEVFTSCCCGASEIM